MSKTALLRLFRLSATLGLIAYVLYDAELFTREGWISFVATLKGAHIGFLLFYLAMHFVADFVCTVKWRLLSKAVGLNDSTWTLFCYYTIGRFFNLVLPSNIGGDVVRISLQGRSAGNPAAAAATVFLDRLTGFAALLVVAMVVAVLYAQAIDVPFMIEATALSAVGLAVLIWASVDHRPLSLARNLATKVHPKFGAVLAKLEKARQIIALYGNKRFTLLMALVISFVFCGLSMVNLWANVLVFDTSASLTTMVIAAPLIMMIMNIPISIGNYGLMEFSFAVILGTLGVPSSVALSAVLLARVKSFLAAGIGAVLYNVIKVDIPKQVFERSTDVTTTRST